MVVADSTPPTSQPEVDEPSIFCPDCNYNLRGAVADRCPSCGWEIQAQELIDAATGRFQLHRVLTILGSLAVGLLCLVPLGLMVSQNRGRLNLHDAVAVLAVIVGVLGHFGAAVAAVRSRNRWPLSSRSVGQVLVFVGASAIVLALVGASRFLRLFDDPKMVRGVTVSNVVDFGLAALLYGLPGWSLLVITMTAFTWRRRRTVDVRAESPAATMPQQSPFFVEIVQRYDRKQVTTTRVDDRRRTTAAIEAAIQESWLRSLEEAKATNRMLFDSTLGRLAKAVGTSKSSHLELSETTYREFHGTNLCHAAGVIEGGVAAFANPLGTSAIVATADGMIALGRRGARVAHYAGYVHCFGGLLEEADKTGNGSYDVMAAMLRELNEETHWAEGELSQLVVIGLVRDRSIVQPELVFEAATKVNREALLTRFSKSGDGEHGEFVFVHDEPESVFQFLAKASLVTPVAQAGLLIHGRHAWGESWYDQSCYLLYGELPPKWEGKSSELSG